MDIWIDSVNTPNIQKAVRLGFLSGVTTNPTLISESNENFEDILKGLLHHQEGPVAVQVVSSNTADMVQEGQNLFSYSTRIIVKVPITKNGLEAIHLLGRQGIPTMATVVFTPHQALMAALADADYIAPYIGRIENSGADPWMVLTAMAQILKNYKFKTQILGASIKTVEHAAKCAEIGISGITVRDEIFEKLIEDNPLTAQCVNKFAEDWKNVNTPLFA
ncbi:MAG: hypothetical protein H0W88_03735 [Parachlamydiaceae bacterium]|nr:hypothetical protein [Parachlamydiaceae bacterium]